MVAEGDGTFWRARRWRSVLRPPGARKSRWREAMNARREYREKWDFESRSARL
jgi:hypothetical protein